MRHREAVQASQVRQTSAGIGPNRELDAGQVDANDGTRDQTWGVPKDWIKKPSKTGGGVRYVDPRNQHNSIRIMPGDPNSRFPNSRRPYVRLQRDGRALDINRSFVEARSEAAHIPLEKFKFDAKVFE